MFSLPDLSDLLMTIAYVITLTETENPYAEEWFVDITCLDYPGLIDE